VRLQFDDSMAGRHDANPRTPQLRRDHTMASENTVGTASLGPQTPPELQWHRMVASLPEFDLGPRSCKNSWVCRYQLELLSICAGAGLGAAYHLRYGGNVEVPAGVLVGLMCAVLLEVLPKLLRSAAYTLGLRRGRVGRCGPTGRQSLRPPLAGQLEKACSSTSSGGTRMYLTPCRLPSYRRPLPKLDLHPLLGNVPPYWPALWPEGAKDWFRILQKASVDTLSAGDIAVAPAQQVAFLLPSLLLRPDFEHLQEQLREQLVRNRSLAFQAFCFCRSEEDHRHRQRINKWLREALHPHRMRRFERCVAFYESLALLDPACEAQAWRLGEEDADGLPRLPEGCVSPFSGEALVGPMGGAVAVHIERRFCSGHGPTLLCLDYSWEPGGPAQFVRSGDVVEACICGSWRPGYVGDVRDGEVDFRDFSGTSRESIKLAELRPWPRQILVKPDSVTNDAVVVSLFRLFNYLWRYSFIPGEFTPMALDFEVLPAGRDFGFVEFVENSVPAREFKWESLSAYNERQLQVFLRTAAGSIVAGHVLGIGDRHQDNILMRLVEMPEVGECVQFFQVDFKHFLGRHTRIDAPSIAIPFGMKDVLRQMSALPLSTRLLGSVLHLVGHAEQSAATSDRWAELKALCGMAFRVLRRSNGFIVHLCRLLMRSPELDAQAVEAFLAHSLRLDVTEDEAVEDLCRQIEDSPHLLAKMVKDFSHTVSAPRL